MVIVNSNGQHGAEPTSEPREGSQPVGRVRQRVVGGDRSLEILGSDRRATGGVEGECRLCGATGQLRLSHVVPKWAYRWMKAEGSVMGSIRSKNVTTESQDGPKHYLLCDPCEQRLGDAENYVATFTRGRKADLDTIGVGVADGPTITGLDTDKLFRCLLGILIKGHFSDSSPFETIKLDRHRLRQLRRRVLEDDYDTVTIAAIATRWVSCLEPGVNPRAMMFASTHRIDGSHWFSAMMGGIEWLVRYDGGRLRSPELRQYELPADPGRIMVGEIFEYRNVNHGVFHPSDVSSRPPWLDHPDALPCPCGLSDDTSADCCGDVWVAHAHNDYGPPDVLSETERERRHRELDRLLEQNRAMSR